MKISILAFYFVSFYAIAFPIFYSSFGTAGAILVNGGLILLILCHNLFLSNSKISFNSKEEKKVVENLLFLFYLYLFSILISTVFSPVVIFQDFYEIHRPVLYILIFIFGLFFFKKENRLKHMERLLYLTSIFIIILGINQYFNIEDTITLLYTKPKNMQTGRVSAPFANPYDYSFYALLMFCYFSIKTLKSNQICFRLLYSSFCIVSTIFIFLTQSRTGFLLLVIECFVIIPFILLLNSNFLSTKSKFSKTILRFLIFLLTIIVVSVVLYNLYGEDFDYLTSALKQIMIEGNLSRSGQARVYLLEFALNESTKNIFVFFFGHGPSKAVLENPEAGYTYFIFRYGFSTLILFFFTPLLITCFLLIKLIKFRGTNTAIYMALLAWYLSIPIAYLSTNFTEQIRLSFLYYLTMAFTVRSYFIYKNKRHAKLH